MPRKYLAFDLEIAKEIPDGGDWRDNSPLGISCAAVLPSDSAQPITWYGKTPAGGPSGQMTREEVKAMVERTVGDALAKICLLVRGGGLTARVAVGQPHVPFPRHGGPVALRFLQPHLTCFQFCVLSAVSKIRGPFRSCRSSIRSTLPNPAVLSVSTISPNRSHFESADIPEKGSE